jgi:hypothetical protein
VAGWDARDGTTKLETGDGMGPTIKNKAGWDLAGSEDTGHGAGRDDFLVVPRSSDIEQCANTFIFFLSHFM